MSTNTPAISCQDISKSYGSVRALSGANLSVDRGTIHALVGQNGAGKSTLLGLLAGRIIPSAGQIKIFGKDVRFQSPREGRSVGVVAIYQELSIVPDMSALENVFLGRTEATRIGTVNFASMRAQFHVLANKLGALINPNQRAGSLSVADQQILEIMRAVQFGAQIILFDEPTASLAPAERAALFSLMRDLRSNGHTLMIVSHNLDEVLDLADDITVFRDGKLIATKPTSEWSKRSLIAEMLGKEIDDIYRKRGSHFAGTASTPLLTVSNLCVPGAVHDLDLSLHRGEILGLGGLVGSGRTTVLRAVAGAEPSGTGQMYIDGQAQAWPRSVRAAYRYGIGLAPEDRKSQGLFLQMRTAENIVITDMRRCVRGGLLLDRLLLDHAGAAGIRFHIDRRRLRDPVGNLSGGNQQKAMLSRWNFHSPDVLLIDEPTRGIDVGAKSEILDSLREMADQGMGIIMVSSELEELVAVADRVLVLAKGRATGELEGENLTVAGILQGAFQVEEAHV